jgi:hypothetical protein
MDDLEKRLHLIRIALNDNMPPISREQQRWLVDKAIELRETLYAVEWVLGGKHYIGDYSILRGVPVCPWCKGEYPNHKPDCQRQAALSQKEE